MFSHFPFCLGVTLSCCGDDQNRNGKLLSMWELSCAATLWPKLCAAQCKHADSYPPTVPDWAPTGVSVPCPCKKKKKHIAEVLCSGICAQYKRDTIEQNHSDILNIIIISVTWLTFWRGLYMENGIDMVIYGHFKTMELSRRLESPIYCPLAETSCITLTTAISVKKSLFCPKGFSLCLNQDSNSFTDAASQTSSFVLPRSCSQITISFSSDTSDPCVYSASHSPPSLWSTFSWLICQLCWLVSCAGKG